uniref:EF-hand domain-containing protein n=1 Tax=Macrostomum lignano TaxID=282301 RepID=A0A1I8I2U3_9PLAT
MLREDDRDQELVMRAVEHFVTHHNYFDIPALKADLQQRDTDKRGRIARAEIVESCAKHDCPVYGAVFNSLLKRCDPERNDFISWPEFTSFLERAQETFFEHVPDAPRVAPEKQNTPTTARMEMQSKLKSLAW